MQIRQWWLRRQWRGGTHNNKIINSSNQSRLKPIKSPRSTQILASSVRCSIFQMMKKTKQQVLQLRKLQQEKNSTKLRQRPKQWQVIINSIEGRLLLQTQVSRSKQVQVSAEDKNTTRDSNLQKKSILMRCLEQRTPTWHNWDRHWWTSRKWWRCHHRLRIIRLSVLLEDQRQNICRHIFAILRSSVWLRNRTQLDSFKQNPPLQTIHRASLLWLCSSNATADITSLPCPQSTILAIHM